MRPGIATPEDTFLRRQYPTQEVQGFCFGMSQAQANEWVHRLSILFNQALGDELQLPERRPARLEGVLSACPSNESDRCFAAKTAHM